MHSMTKGLFVGVFWWALHGTVIAADSVNLEGYGALATGTGNAGFAYDNGVSALMNNPAMLGMMPDDSAEPNLVLAPEISSSHDSAQPPSSAGDVYFMPAFGYDQRNGNLTWAVGVNNTVDNTLITHSHLSWQLLYTGRFD